MPENKWNYLYLKEGEPYKFIRGTEGWLSSKETLFAYAVDLANQRIYQQLSSSYPKSGMKWTVIPPQDIPDWVKVEILLHIQN